jgi:hypothetical protein
MLASHVYHAFFVVDKPINFSSHVQCKNICHTASCHNANYKEEKMTVSITQKKSRNTNKWYHLIGFKSNSN